jgi:pyruvate dehydrogenase kinase 2/3/4
MAAAGGAGYRITDALRQKLAYYARFPQRSAPLKDMVEFGVPAPAPPNSCRPAPPPRLARAGHNPSQTTLLRAAQFLREELPVRLARRVIELESLPLGLSAMAPIQKVAGWYALSFEELASLPSSRHYDPNTYVRPPPPAAPA